MTRCDEFYDKVEKDGNFCGMSKSSYGEVMQYIKFREEHSAIAALSEDAVMPLIREQDPEIRAKAIEAVGVAVNHGKTRTAADVKDHIEKIRAGIKSKGHVQKPRDVVGLAKKYNVLGETPIQESEKLTGVATDPLIETVDPDEVIDAVDQLVENFRDDEDPEVKARALDAVREQLNRGDVATQKQQETVIENKRIEVEKEHGGPAERIDEENRQNEILEENRQNEILEENRQNEILEENRQNKIREENRIEERSLKKVERVVQEIIRDGLPLNRLSAVLSGVLYEILTPDGECAWHDNGASDSEVSGGLKGSI